MGLLDRITNIFSDGKTTNNNAANNFLRYGDKTNRLNPTWSGVTVAPEDSYRGYPYAAVQRKGNRVASIAKRNLYVDVTPELLQEYQKLGKDPIHPYLKLIQESTSFSTKKFWKTISVYLDLAGRYYLGVVRQPTNYGMSYIKKFVLLNPFEIRRVIDRNGQVAGYVEYKADGRKRNWQPHQIITFIEESPFDTSQPWSMVDAAKPAIYTLNQSGDHTRQSLNGNLNAPGIITTDVILDDIDFENFKARIMAGTKGEPIFANGAGAVQWQDMQIDLNKAALLDINEINRDEFIAVAGASKTNLGIEQSGTTRETARVQDDNYIRDSIEPRVEDITDVLNLDYRTHYSKEFERTGYTIELRSALSKDYDSEMKATELRSSQAALAQDLVNKGYTLESAVSYATGKSDLEDLVIDEDRLKAEEEARKAQEQAEKEAKEQEASTQEEKPTTENSPINIHIEAPKAPENKVVVQESDKQPVVNVSPVINIDNSTQEITEDKPEEEEVDEPDDQGWVGAKLEPVNVSERLNESGLDTSVLTNVSDLLPETTNIPGQENPHVTLVYGLKDEPSEIKDQILKIVEESGLKEVTIEKISHFPIETGFALVALLEKSDELVKAHEDLLKLDHYTQKYPDYNPHMTLAYLDDMKINGELVNPDEYYVPFEDLVGKTIKVTDIDLDEDSDDIDDIDDIDNSYHNDITPDDFTKVETVYNELIDKLSDVHQRILNVSLQNITVNSFTQTDLMPADISKDFSTEIGDFLKEYWLYIAPIFGLAFTRADRLGGAHPEYVMSEEIRTFINERAKVSGKGHMETVLNDVLRASNKAYSQIMSNIAIQLIQEAYERNPDKFKDYFSKKPTKKQVQKAIDNTDILEANRKIYDKANKMALEGFSRDDIIKDIRQQFTEVSKNRATLIARHETSRAYVQSQYDADKQLLEVTGKLKNAYKQLYSRTGHPCAYCQELIDRGPVPFESNFLDKGDSIDIVENGKKYTFTADYEDIVGGCLHPNCSCSYKLIIKNSNSVNTYTPQEGDNLQKVANLYMNQGCDENCTHQHNEIWSNNG